MKKVIEAKVYNTETATLIAETGGGGALGYNFSAWYEALYRTRKGVLFIAGQGGPMSSYARSCGQNGICGGSDIRVVTPQEAREWLESAEADEDCYEAAGLTVEAA